MEPPPPPAQASNRVWGIALLAAGCFAVGMTVFMATTPGDPCVRRAAAIDESWGPDRRASLEHTLASSTLAYAPTTAERLLPRLDAWTQRWHQTSVATCRADRAAPAPLTTAGRVACLQDARAEFDAMLDVLDEGSDAAIRRSIVNATALPAPEACARQTPRGGDATTLAPAVAKRASHLHDQLRLARARASAGQSQLAMESSLEIAGRANEYGITAVVIDARLLQAQIRSDRAEQLAAGSDWHNAFALAIRAGDSGRALAAARALAVSTAEDQARAAGAAAWIERAHNLLRAPGASDRAAETDLHYARGSMLLAQNDPTAAQTHLEQAVATGDETWGKRDLRLVPVLQQLARAQAAAGNEAAATQSHARALAIATEALGPDHPDVPTRAATEPHAE